MSNQQAINRFTEAREHYVARRFNEARAAMRRYRKNVQYEKFTRADQRESLKPAISVVIVSYGTGHGLIDCIATVLKQQGPLFEIVVVDNGGNDTVHEQLGRLPLLWISPPVNLLPSEGRNVGAYFAQSDLLVFLDDDALMEPGYLTAAIEAMADPSCIGLRGRIKPQTPGSVSPPHYDLGEVATNSEFNLEGNMVMRKSDFAAIGGFDPLMFGHEGKALTQQAKIRFFQKNVVYLPVLEVKHDWAVADRLDKKNLRQALGRDYLDYLSKYNLNQGLSVVIRHQEKDEMIIKFLDSLINHSGFKPLEVLLIPNDSLNSLRIVRPYLSYFSVRVLPLKTVEFNDIYDVAKYANIMIFESIVCAEEGMLERWVKHGKTGHQNVKLANKEKLPIYRDERRDTPNQNEPELKNRKNIAASLGGIKKILEQDTDVVKSRVLDGLTHSLKIKDEGKIEMYKSLSKKSNSTKIKNHEFELNRKIKVLVVSPRQLGILGTPGTYLFVEALSEKTELVVLCDINGRPTDQAPRVHNSSKNINNIEVPFKSLDEKEIKSLIEDFEPEIIHIMIWQKWSVMARLLKKCFPKSSVVLDIKTPLLATGQSREEIQKEGDASRNLPDLIVTRVLDEEKTWIPKNDVPVFEYPLGVSIDGIHGATPDSPNRKIKCVYIGSIHPKRQIERLLDLWSMLHAGGGAEFHLDIYGAGGDPDELWKRVTELGLRKKVKIYNALPQDELFFEIKKYDLGIAWVPWEDYEKSPSLKFLEYGACGLEIVATNTFGHKRNLIDGYRAHLFENTPDSFMSALANAHSQVLTKRANDVNYRLSVERDWSFIVSQYFLYIYRCLKIDSNNVENNRINVSEIYADIYRSGVDVRKHPFVVRRLEYAASRREMYEYP
jgi:glycosyltransferase involved in cell wall biosynthesis